MKSNQPSSIEENQIIPGVGLGPLRFGASRDQVRALVGEPEEIEESEADEAEFKHEEWIYHEDDYLVSLSFDEEDSFRLSCIETDNSRMRLFGEVIVGESVERVRNLMEQYACGTPEIETMDGGEVRLFYEQVMIDMYFVDGKLQFVNFGVFIDQVGDDMVVQWPE